MRVLRRLRRVAKRMLGLHPGVKEGEIKNDDFYHLIRRCAARPYIQTILEIGASTGDGSTEALTKGMALNPRGPSLYCIEAVKDRFEVLARRYAENPAVKCYNVSSVGLEKYPTEELVRRFFRVTPFRAKAPEVDVVLGWLRGETQYIRDQELPQDGIETIKRENGLTNFDLVLIDGSEFTGTPELDAVYGAKLILLDDIVSFKNHYNVQRLAVDPAYRLIEADLRLRNGYAAFERTSPAHPGNQDARPA